MSTRANEGRFRAWRKREGLSLYEVADLTGVSVPMLSLVERGERQFAPLTRVRVARALGVPIRELFEPDSADAGNVELIEPRGRRSV